MSNVAINIAAEFTGKPAFDKASKSAAGLGKQVKTLTKLFGSALLVQYGKQAVKAFADDEAAAQRLSTAVKNLGYSFSQVKVADFISNLEKQSGVLDDKLRPAFQSLLTTTGSLTQSQKLLNDAIQISRGSGEDLSTVANDLAQAYVGNTKGIKKYYTGLTQAELKTKSFSEILSVLLANSAGSAEAYLSTTAYKMDVLTVATNNAKESIGAGLVDAFARMSGGSEAKDAAKTINDMAKVINFFTGTVGFAVGALTKLYSALDKVTTFGGLTGENGTLGMGSRFDRNKPLSTNRSRSAAGTYQRNAQEIKAEMERVKNAKKLTDLAKQRAAAEALALKKKQDQAALDKLSLQLAKGEDIFNLDAIQIQAALTSQTEQLAKVTNQSQLLAVTNDMTRLKIKQDILVLEKAIADGDVAAATAAADRLNTDLKNLGVLQGQSVKLADINRILAGMVSKDLINLTNLNLALDKVKQMYELLNGGKAGMGGNLSQDSAGFVNVGASATVDEMVKAADLNTQYLLDMAAANDALLATISKNPVGTSSQPQINNYFGGSVVTDQKLIDMVLSGAQLSSLSGSPSQIGRISGMFS
jgi:hypothetical protein